MRVVKREVGSVCYFAAFVYILWLFCRSLSSVLQTGALTSVGRVAVYAVCEVQPGVSIFVPFMWRL